MEITLFQYLFAMFRHESNKARSHKTSKGHSRYLALRVAIIYHDYRPIEEPLAPVVVKGFCETRLETFKLLCGEKVVKVYFERTECDAKAICGEWQSARINNPRIETHSFV